MARQCVALEDDSSGRADDNERQKTPILGTAHSLRKKDDDINVR
jgi:hypothetical protein